MGTHPIFESDFDCLTETRSKMHIRFNEAIVNVETTDELLNMVPSGEVLSAPIQAGFTLEQVGIAPNSTICTQAGLLGGKVHGSLARAGKVKGQTPKVDAEEKKKAKTGRAKRRMQYNRRFVNVVPTFGKKKGPNSNSFTNIMLNCERYNRE